MRIMLTVLLSLLVVAPAHAKKKKKKDEAALDAAKFAAVSFTDEDGASRTLDEFSGKVVLLDFWATWCGPCKQSLPIYSEWQKELEGDLVVLAASVDEETDDVPEFLEALAPGLTLMFDTGHAAAEKLDVPGMPTAFLIGRDGKPVSRWVGFKDKESTSLKSAIDREVKK